MLITHVLYRHLSVHKLNSLGMGYVSFNRSWLEPISKEGIGRGNGRERGRKGKVRVMETKSQEACETNHKLIP